MGTELTYYEQRGKLTYMKPDGLQFRDSEGWFHVEGSTVVKRKIRGRNRFAFCSVASVYDFIPYKKETAND
jgi:hypothetical protein